METNPKHPGELSESTSPKMVAHTNGIMSTPDVLQLMNVPLSIGNPKNPEGPDLYDPLQRAQKRAEFVLTLKALRPFSWFYVKR